MQSIYVVSVSVGYTDVRFEFDDGDAALDFLESASTHVDANTKFKCSLWIEQAREDVAEVEEVKE